MALYGWNIVGRAQTKPTYLDSIAPYSAHFKFSTSLFTFRDMNLKSNAE